MAGIAASQKILIKTCMTRFSKTFGPAASWVAFDAFGDFFFACPKKKQKRALSCAEGLGTAQSAFVVARHAPACEVDCKMNVGYETDLRAVRDGFH